MRRHVRIARIFPLPQLAIALFGLFVLGSGAFGAATITIINLDGAGEGFNDPTPVAPVGGNPGTTLGEQRLNAFTEAARFWAFRLDSAVVIDVDAEMGPLPCSAGSGVLGGAGANFVFRDWPEAGGPPLAATWYHSALADRLAGVDLDADPDGDIGAIFNSDVDDDPGCLTGLVWYYGYDAAPAGTIGFIETVKHEIGHGLGVQSFVDDATGETFFGFDDVYMTFLEDHGSGAQWNDLDDAQRQASAIDTTNLHWTGPAVTGASSILSAGTVGSHVRMYAPDPVEPGSSVSHWDTALEATGGGLDELMEPFLTNSSAVLLTDEMLEDEGWNSFGGTSCVFDSTPLVLTNPFTGTQSFDACTSITAETNAVVPAGADTTLRAGLGIILGNGFSVESGGTFTAIVDGAFFE